MGGGSKRNSGRNLAPHHYTSTNAQEDAALDASRSFSHRISSKVVLTVAKNVDKWDLRNPKEAREFIKSVRVGKNHIHWILDDFGGKIAVNDATDKQIMQAIKHIAKAMRQGEATGEDH